MQSYRQASKDTWFGIDQAIKKNGKSKPVVKKNKGSLSSRTRDALARDEYASWSGHGREEDA